jgi:hypothetical protein
MVVNAHRVMNGKPVLESQSIAQDPFLDVAKTDFYAVYFDELKSMKVLTGMFVEPFRLITREDLIETLKKL